MCQTMKSSAPGWIGTKFGENILGSPTLNSGDCDFVKCLDNLYNCLNWSDFPSSIRVALMAVDCLDCWSCFVHFLLFFLNYEFEFNYVQMKLFGCLTGYKQLWLVELTVDSWRWSDFSFYLTLPEHICLIWSYITTPSYLVKLVDQPQRTNCRIQAWTGEVVVGVNAA